MSARKWLLAMAAVVGLATVGWAQGPGGGRQCGGGGGQMQGGGGQSMMRGGGGQGMMRPGGGPGMMTGNNTQMQQLQALQQQVLLGQLQAQMTAINLLAANEQGRANHARLLAAQNKQLQAGK